MNKLLTAISLLLLFAACQPGVVPRPEDQGTFNTKDTNAAVAVLNNLIGKYAPPAQHFRVSGATPSQVTGKNGTILSIVPEDLVFDDGTPVNGAIDIELKELVNPQQLLLDNAPTMSDGKLLVSGGAYYINMTSGGKSLKIKENRSLKVQFPKLTKQNMAMFYGQRDNAGTMNWKATEEIFTVKPLESSNTGTNVKSVADTADLEWGDMDAILHYVNGDTTGKTEKEKKEIADHKRHYKMSRDLYSEIGIQRLGWINCDRFLEIENKAAITLTFNPADSLEIVSSYLVFNNINGVMQQVGFGGQNIEFADIPVGFKIKLIIFTVKSGQILAFSAPYTVSSNQKIPVALNPVSENEFGEMLKK